MSTAPTIQPGILLRFLHPALAERYGSHVVVLYCTSDHVWFASAKTTFTTDASYVPRASVQPLRRDEYTLSVQLLRSKIFHDFCSLMLNRVLDHELHSYGLFDEPTLWQRTGA